MLVRSIITFILLVSIKSLTPLVSYIGDNFHIQYYDLHDENDNKLWAKSGFPTYIFVLITKTMPFFS